MSNLEGLTVGELVGRAMFAMGKGYLYVPDGDRERLVAVPPQITVDLTNHILRVKLADGCDLNVHIRAH